MSHKPSFRFLLVLLFAAFGCAALVLADASARVQNANSSMTEETQNDNANMTAAPRRGRRNRRRPPVVEREMTVIAPVIQDDDSRGDLSGEQVDLSGTYEGSITTTGGHEMSGPATLTITGSSFTLAGEGMNHSGRIYAVLTRGEVSAALYFSDISVGTPPTPLGFNVRARKRGETLRLWPAPQTKDKLTFTQGRTR